jgi:hypothetical protein
MALGTLGGSMASVRRDPRRLVGAAVAVAAITALALLLFGGGKDTVPLSTVAKAAEATNGAGGFKVTVEGGITAGSRKVPLKAHGELDEKGQRGHLIFDSAGIPGAGGAGGPQIEQIIDGRVIYMKMPALTRQLGGDKAWIRLDYDALGKELGIDASSLGQGNNDPRKMLAQLKAVSGEVEKVGSEKVRGIDTTHYKAKIDVRKTPDTLPPDQREAARSSVERLIDITGNSTYPVEIWIDGKDLVRRMRLEYAFDVPSQKDKANFEMTMELFDFGTQVNVQPPPSGQVADFRELAKKLAELQAAQGGQAPGAGQAPGTN